MAMTGISRDYLSETHNEDDLRWLSALPENVLYMHENEFHRSGKPTQVPANHIAYASAKEKKLTLANQKRAHDERMAAHREKFRSECEAILEQKLLAVAMKLYEFAAHNEPWEEAMQSVRDVYIYRAERIIEIV